MNIRPIGNQPRFNFVSGGRFLDHLKNFLVPLKDGTLGFVQKEPITTAGSVLTFMAILVGIISKETVKFSPLFGIPGVALILCRMLPNTTVSEVLKPALRGTGDDFTTPPDPLKGQMSLSDELDGVCNGRYFAAVS